MQKIIIYTDGSSINNPGNGGWAAYLIYGDVKKMISGFKANVTNNQMELSAVIEALSILKNECEIEIFTDSQYIVNGMKTWIFNWMKNNWKTSNKKPVENKELWEKLYTLSQNHKINWNWIKAHNGTEFNELVDKEARRQAMSIC